MIVAVENNKTTTKNKIKKLLTSKTTYDKISELLVSDDKEVP